jgi:hypothetical protein
LSACGPGRQLPNCDRRDDRSWIGTNFRIAILTAMSSVLASLGICPVSPGHEPQAEHEIGQCFHRNRHRLLFNDLGCADSAAPPKLERSVPGGGLSQKRSSKHMGSHSEKPVAGARSRNRTDGPSPPLARQEASMPDMLDWAGSGSRYASEIGGQCVGAREGRGTPVFRFWSIRSHSCWQHSPIRFTSQKWNNERSIAVSPFC